MKKSLIVLLIIDVILAGSAYLIIYDSRGKNDFSGLGAVFPEFGALILSIVILILNYFYNLKNTLSSKDRKIGFPILLWRLLILLGTPAIAICYSAIYSDPTDLVWLTLGTVAFVIGSYACIRMVSNGVKITR